MSDKVGVYIHVPFCKKRCSYCDFYSGADISAADEYTEALIKHINTYENIGCDTVYFGGGTPTYFGEDRLCDVLNAVKNTFDVCENAEITAECNPKTVSLEGLCKMRKSGFNRLSIGMQSAVQKELDALGRINTAYDAENTVFMARKAGFENISLDLMYGIPYQTLGSFSETLDFALSLSPQHISAYMLKLEEGTPLCKNADKYPFADEDEIVEMMSLCNDTLEKNGIFRYEISNYAKKGMESRHNLKYWNRDEYISFGPSSSSFYKGRRYTYTPCIGDYKDFCFGKRNEKDVLCEEEFPTEKEAEGEYIMLRLRLTDGISKDEYKKITGKDFDTEYGEKIRKYVSLGFMKDAERVSFTDKGFALSNVILGDIVEF